MNPAQKYTMKYVSGKTGLTPHTIRAWEKRYGAVVPERSESNRRLYSNADIERLLLLRRATLSGHSIGRIARLPMEDLRELVETDSTGAIWRSSPPETYGEAATGEIIEEALKALHLFDQERLERVLHHASATYNLPVLIEKIISPFLERLGDLWIEGTLRVAQEHLSSGIIRVFLANLSRQNISSQTDPLLLVTTPAGQHHEFGALFAAVVASSCGWRTMYLGPNLPAEEIAGAAEINRARAVALSIIHPADDPRLAEELMRIRRCLLPDIQIVAGGRSAAFYRGALDAIHAVTLNSSAELRSYLNALRLSSQ